MIQCPLCGFRLDRSGVIPTCRQCSQTKRSDQCQSSNFSPPLVPNPTGSFLPTAQVPVVARPMSWSLKGPAVPRPVVPVPPTAAAAAAAATYQQQPAVPQLLPVELMNQRIPLNTSNALHFATPLQEYTSSYPYNPEHNPEYNPTNSYNTAPAPAPASAPAPAQHSTGRRMCDDIKWGNYNGTFNSMGQMHGYGKMKYDDGSLYEGLWKNNLKEGSGTLYYSSGPKLVGNWVRNKINGSGTYYYPDGKVDLRMYHKDKCIGVGVQYSPDRQVASKLNCGRVKKWISLTEASKISSNLGLPVPR